MQFYRGMDIGTAKVTEAERRGVPHHLLDILDVTEEASVSDFQQRARAVIADIHARGKRAILVGGSGLYVRAALDVLEFPGTDPAIRRRLEAEAEAAGLAPLRSRLESVDPVSAVRLGDARRVIRALEVFELTGRPFSSFMPSREYFRPASADRPGGGPGAAARGPRRAGPHHGAARAARRSAAPGRLRPAPGQDGLPRPGLCPVPQGRGRRVRPGPAPRKRQSSRPASLPAASSPGSAPTRGSAGSTGRTRSWWPRPRRCAGKGRTER